MGSGVGTPSLRFGPCDAASGTTVETFSCPFHVPLRSFIFIWLLKQFMCRRPTVLVHRPTPPTVVVGPFTTRCVVSLLPLFIPPTPVPRVVDPVVVGPARRRTKGRGTGVRGERTEGSRRRDCVSWAGWHNPFLILHPHLVPPSVPLRHVSRSRRRRES